MDWKEYDMLQAELGGIGDTFKSSTEKILLNSAVDEHAKALVREICKIAKLSLGDMSLCVAKTLTIVSR